MGDAMKNITTKTDKYKALKDNINMLVLGLGIEQYHCNWSKNGKTVPIDFLIQHLEQII